MVYITKEKVDFLPSTRSRIYGQSRSWSGKKSGNPLVVRGGYNCRHQFSYVNPDWYDKKGELII